MERLQKFLTNAGFCSRRTAEELIKKGLVSVNGRLADLGMTISEKDVITVNGKKVEKEAPLYIMLHKPKNYLSAMDDRYQRTIANLVPEELYHIGRLDKDARGLLLLTNDGDFANKVMHPRYGVTKTYEVKLDRPLQKSHKMAITNGVKLRDGMIRARIKQLSKNFALLTIAEGKNKIVKRLFNHFGLRVIDLKRVKIGQLKLNVQPGKYRELTKKDLDKVFLK